MFRILLVLFIVVPAVEIFFIIKVGQVIGAMSTLALIVLTGILGAWLARSQGRQTLLLAQMDMQQGRVPAEAIMDGLAILVGGLVLLTPGFFTDIIGFLLLIPVSRALIKMYAKKIIAKMINQGNVYINTR